MEETRKDPLSRKSGDTIREDQPVQPAGGSVPCGDEPHLVRNQIRNLENRIAVLEFALQSSRQENEARARLVAQRENSVSWRMSQVFGSFIPPRSFLGKKVSAFVSRFVRQVQGHLQKPADTKPGKQDERTRELARIIGECGGTCRGIILCPPTIDWNFPLFQRYQQLALALADRGYLVFFSTIWKKFDRVSGFQKLSDRCYLTDQYPLLVRELPRFTSLVPSTNITLGFREIQALQEKSFIVYDFLDEISDKITPVPLSAVAPRHEYLIRNADLVLATADSLYDQARQKRDADVLLVPNAVDYPHFHIPRNPDTIPADMRPVIDRKNPVIGYYGALATWFDYELVIRLARERPRYEIVIIGWDFDGSRKKAGLETCPNIHVLEVKPYSVLPEYAIWFDVAMIPFVLNDITRATSPVKLFEYLALGNPVVATAMAECRKYRSVLIGSSPEDFIGKIDLALTCRQDRDYLRLMDTEARENTWTARAAAIDTILSSKKVQDPIPPDSA